MSDGTYSNAAANGQTAQQPAAGAPASKNATSAPQARTIPVGTRIEVTITQTLSASHNEVGDRFTGVLTRPVLLAGQPVLARGTRVEGSVVASKGRGHFAGAGDLGIELTSIAGEHVSTSEYERAAKGRGKRTAGFIGGGAGLGAILGAVAGGGRGAAIGALAGGGAGTAGAAYTGSRDVVIPSESVVTFRLRSPLSVN